MLTYTVELEPQPEGGYTATVPALPGCISEGDTIKAVLKNIQDAIDGYIQTLTKHRREIPIEYSKLRRVSLSMRTMKRKLAQLA